MVFQRLRGGSTVPSSSGIPGPSTFTVLRRKRPAAAAAMNCCKPHFRLRSTKCGHDFVAMARGPANSIIFARTDARSSSNAGCNCSPMVRCWKSIAISRRATASKRRCTKRTAAALAGSHRRVQRRCHRQQEPRRHHHQLECRRRADFRFHRSQGNRPGQPITIVIPHDRQDEERLILTRIRRGERIDHFETVRQRKDGNPIMVSR